MKTIKRKKSKPLSKKIVAVKVMVFLSWLLYIGIAFANNMMIEAFIFSVGVVIIGYLIFGRKPSQKPDVTSIIKSNQLPNENSPNHNYLSVFFHRTDEAV